VQAGQNLTNLLSNQKYSGGSDRKNTGRSAVGLDNLVRLVKIDEERPGFGLSPLH
jgi:hypothetical protein